jgi:hypothetical protein
MPTHFASNAEKERGKKKRMRMIYASARWLVGQLPLTCSTFSLLSLTHSALFKLAARMSKYEHLVVSLDQTVTVALEKASVELSVFEIQQR